MASFDDYIVYVDESGDHSMASPNPEYPVFVLAFCLFEKARYASECAPAMIRFKFAHLGHDQVVLHERDIRKRLGSFAFLHDSERRARFLDGLSSLVAQAPFTLVAAAIHKVRYAGAYTVHLDPYHLAVEYGLERLYQHLRRTLGCDGGTLHIVFEQRGRTEDRDLELEFRRVCDGHNALGARMPFEFVLADKRGNSTGLQLADLVARPVGLRVLRPDQPNRAWDVLEAKFRRSPSGSIGGWGLKVFPSDKRRAPE